MNEREREREGERREREREKKRESEIISHKINASYKLFPKGKTDVKVRVGC